MGSKKGVLVKERGDQDGTRHLELRAVTNDTNGSDTIEVYLPQSKVVVLSELEVGLLPSPKCHSRTQADRGSAIFIIWFPKSP